MKPLRVNGVPVGPVPLVVGQAFHPQDALGSQGGKDALDGSDGPERELFVPFGDGVIHPPPALLVAVGVAGGVGLLDLEPVVDLLQEDGFVKADLNGEGGQDLERGFVNEEGTGHWSSPPRADRAEETAAEKEDVRTGVAAGAADVVESDIRLAALQTAIVEKAVGVW